MNKEELEKFNSYVKSAKNYLEIYGFLSRYCCKCIEEIRGFLAEFHEEVSVYRYGIEDTIKFPAEVIDVVDKLKYVVEYTNNYFKDFNNKKNLEK